MSKDPFYEQILAGLEGALDPQVFEDCMADILRKLFPTLVPVHGGRDSGMDGAITDGEGEPFPLVTTTAKDARRNLRKNIKSFLKRKQPPRKVVFATSRSLTPQRQLGLKELAREKGFTLVHLVEQRGVANLLHSNPRWCKQLLGLSGQPSALSVIPRSRRPLLDLTPIGRDQDLEWLRQTTGDRVLSGEPGSGKTFLLYHLAREGWGLFLVDSAGDVAGALREQRPRVVIVDDAHARPSSLEELKHLRQQIDMDFSIVATTWEGARDQVIEAMGGISEDKVRKLELMTRSEILEVYQSAGVDEDPDTMRYLVDQAANKPGLAVTIATLWLAGSWREVIDGKVLSRTLLAFFQEFVGPEAIDVLGAFSLGGNRGIEVEAVREFLGLNRLQIRQIAAGLAAGGVLSEVDKDVLAVRPKSLRIALIRTIFFPPSGPRHDYLELVKCALSYDGAISTIIAAKFLGANIGERDLGELVARSKSPGVWADYARLSPESAKWVLENYPGALVDIAAALLHQIPRLVIPKILQRAVELSGKREFRSESVMNILSSWVQDLEAGPQEWIDRRRMVARAAKEFLLSGGVAGIGVYGICISLSPAVRGENLDPGMGTTVTMRWGLLYPSQLGEIESSWEEVESSIQEIDNVSWQHLSSTLWDWVYPEYAARGEVPEDQKLIMRTFAARLLRDLSRRSEHSPGLKAELGQLSVKLGVPPSLEPDPIFALLYPLDNDNLDDRQESKEVWQAAIKSLAEEWATKSPEEVIGRIAFYEREAQRVGHEWLQGMPMLCQFMAEIVSSPQEWLDAMLGENLRRHLMSPFLERIVDLRQGGWETCLEAYLDHKILDWTALSIVLKLQEPPSALLDRALAKAQENTLLVETLCLQGKVPLPTLEKLLSVPSGELALAAAVGEWCAKPRGNVQEEIRPAWRAAILGAKIDESRGNVGFRYWLGMILASDPGLALDWLLTRLQDPDLPRFAIGDNPFFRAIGVLRKEQKQRLLEALTPVPILRFLLPRLIGVDREIYARILEIGVLAEYHLTPLGGMPSSGWESLALAALDAGHAPEAIAKATFWGSSSDAPLGLGPENWERWDQAFARFEGHPRWDLQEVVHHGRALAQEEIRRAHQRQREFELHGLGRDDRTG